MLVEDLHIMSYCFIVIIIRRGCDNDDDSAMRFELERIENWLSINGYVIIFYFNGIP